MILNTGQRTDIPAFYSDWFANRLRAGFVCTRSPYNPTQVTRFRLDPSVVDVIGFCTKNPEPMLRYMDLLQGYGQFWYVTITPYGHDIEPNVPDKRHLLTVFQRLSDIIGSGCIGWRYDPIFISERYTKEYHLRAFSQIAEALEGYTDTVVISFIDLYHKVLRNFPEAHIVPFPDRIQLGKEMVQIAQKHGMTLRPCAEGNYLSEYGADCSGCMSIPMYERAIGHKLLVPRYSPGRRECACICVGTAMPIRAGKRFWQTENFMILNHHFLSAIIGKVMSYVMQARNPGSIRRCQSSMRESWILADRISFEFSKDVMIKYI